MRNTERSGRTDRERSITRSREGTLVVTVGKSGLSEGESRYLEDHEQDAQQGDQLLNPCPEAQDFLL